MPSPDKSPTLALVVRGILSALLIVIGAWSDDPSILPLVIGAVTGYWLREGEGMARRRRHESGKHGGGGPDPTHDVP